MHLPEALSACAQMRKTVGSSDHPGWYLVVPQRTGSQRKPKEKDPCLVHHIHPPVQASACLEM